jgi:hypothetical protein
METEKMTVRGSVALPGQTTRLSTSDATEDSTSVMNDLSGRPRIVIQPQLAAEESTHASSEPSVLSTAIDKTSDSNPKPTDSRDTIEDELDSSVNTLKFHAARVISTGTVVYSKPEAAAALLGELSGRLPIKVLEIRKDWARVTIPNGINVWVFSSYITQDLNGQAQIQGRNVRARWMPSTDSRIVGILAPGEPVRVLAVENQWKQISLPRSIAAWVPVSQLEMLENINPTWLSDWQTETGVRPAVGN